MKKLTVALCATTALFASQAVAADLGRPIYKAPVVVAAPMMWNGFYIGINGGLAAGDASASITGVPGSLDITSRGGFGGGQIGYNWQFSPNWVLGVEADFQGGSIEGSVSLNGLGGGISAGSKTTAFGTARGRVGYAFGNSLLYATGGYAYGKNELFVTGLGGGISIERNHSGWTAGAGLEHAFAPNWTAKVEYLYVDLGSEPYLAAAIVGGPVIALNAEHRFHLPCMEEPAGRGTRLGALPAFAPSDSLAEPECDRSRIFKVC
jgi:outer membrane immunogenic protein